MRVCRVGEVVASRPETLLLGFRDAGHHALGNIDHLAGKVRRVTCLAERAAVDLRGRCYGGVPIDHLQVKWNTTLATIDR